MAVGDAAPPPHETRTASGFPDGEDRPKSGASYSGPARSVPAIEDRLLLAGLSSHCASVRASGMSTLEVDNDPEGAVRAVVEEARIAVETDHAEVICLGCAGMAGLEEAITNELHVPVIDGVGAAVRLAEALVGLGLRTSKRSTYAQPEPKHILSWPLSVALGLRQAKEGEPTGATDRIASSGGGPREGEGHGST